MGSSLPPPPFIFNASIAFTVPVRCPATLVWLGKARANSTYRNVSSFKRRSFNEFQNDSRGFEESLLEALEQSDFSARSDVLSTLFIRRDAPTFNHDPLKHYKSCAPTTCTFTTVTNRTLFQYGIDALNVLGGTSYTVIGFIGFVADAIIVLFVHRSAVFMSFHILFLSHPPLFSWILWFSSMWVHRRVRTSTTITTSDTTGKSGPAALELARISVKQDGVPSVHAWGERPATN